MTSPTLLDFLTAQPGRCGECGFAADVQGHRDDCPDRFAAGIAAGIEAQESVSAAHAEDVARVDAAIERRIKAGEIFSANSLRPELAGVTGAVIGSRFGHYSRSHRIRKVGYEPSTDPRTKGHEIKTWIGT